MIIIKRNKESKARIRVINYFHLNKKDQKHFDEIKSKGSFSYSDLYKSIHMSKGIARFDFEFYMLKDVNTQMVSSVPYYCFPGRNIDINLAAMSKAEK